MSSSAYLSFKEEIPLSDWAAFCEEHAIRYSPNTIGQATFYGGSTEISVTPKGTLRHDERGWPIWSTTQPPALISRMSVGTFFHGDLNSVGDTINAIASRFPCTVSCAPELAHLLLDLPQTHEIDKYDDFLSTDFVEAWTFLDGAYSATVPAGEARISRAGDNWTVEISSIKRGTFIDFDHAFAFAGRANWDWWYGPRPEEPTHTKALPHG